MNLQVKKKKVPVLRFPEFEGEWELKKGEKLFKNKRIKGNKQLPIYSVTLDRGLVPRSSLARTMAKDAKAEDNLQANPMDLVYNMMRMWQGAVGVSYQDCMVSPAYVILEPKNGTDSEFFIHLFQANRYLYLLASYSYGLTSDRLRLYYKDFAVINFRVPSLPEQRKIADFIITIDTRIHQLTRKVDLLEEYRKGVMQQIFSQAIRFKDDQGKDYLAWEEKRLGNISTWASGGTPSKGNKEYWDGEISWISASSMRGNYFDDSDLKITEEGLANGSRLAPKGTILILVRGSMLFKAIPVGIATTDVAFNQDVKSIRAKKNTLTEFLLYWLLASENRLLHMVTGTGIGAGKLDLQELKNLSISLPSLPEQQKIADFLGAIDRKIDLTRQRRDHMQEYKKGLLQQMFV